MDPVQSTSSSISSNQNANRFSELTNDEFVNIITTELANQDPLKPSDTSALLQQISDLRSIQTDMDLGGRLDALVSQNEMASASSLIGSQVTGIASDGSLAEGVVKTVVRDNEGPVLRLSSGQSLMFKQVHEINAPEVIAGGAQ
ncbi:MAG: hypothetical protein H6815_08810 [Phycisphaeraceae bacterium]|nr:hypothetical protein [Phycisphaerales bacterium]MCB9860543.1 hypothetical protein [Phycisphaeraceae bacterium]